MCADLTDRLGLLLSIIEHGAVFFEEKRQEDAAALEECAAWHLRSLFAKPVPDFDELAFKRLKRATLDLTESVEAGKPIASSLKARDLVNSTGEELRRLREQYSSRQVFIDAVEARLTERQNAGASAQSLVKVRLFLENEGILPPTPYTVDEVPLKHIDATEVLTTGHIIPLSFDLKQG